MENPEKMADDFLANLDNNQYIIKRRDYLSHLDYMNSLEHELDEAITDYTHIKLRHGTQYDMHQMAVELVIRLRKARMNNMIQENPITKSRLEACEKENAELKEKNTLLEQENDHLSKQVSELHKLVQKITSKGMKNASGEH